LGIITDRDWRLLLIDFWTGTGIISLITSSLIIVNRNQLLDYEHIFGITIITVVIFSELRCLQYNGKMVLAGILLIPACFLKPICTSNSLLKNFALSGILRPLV
jgi:hypothetical protein